jgi:N-carbamoyl-L-amino-acid hydrolase
MTEQYSLDLDEAQFAKMLFDHVREMSKDVAGVTKATARLKPKYLNT